MCDAHQLNRFRISPIQTGEGSQTALEPEQNWVEGVRHA